MGLYKIGILHRDITNKTILLGKAGAPPGWRGVLIDLSLAFDLDLQADSKINKEPIMVRASLVTSVFSILTTVQGSHLFQSTAVLDSLRQLNEDKAPLAHNYLDDLESFFFVLCYLLFLFMPNGARRALDDKARGLMDGWDDDNADKALQPKLTLFHASTKRSAANLIGASWGMACRVLFMEFHEWLCKVRDEKEALVDEYLEGQEEEEEGEAEGTQTGDRGRSIAPSAGESVPATLSASASEEAPDDHHESIIAPLLRQPATHYDNVLYFFDKAIKALGGANPEPERMRKLSVVPDGIKGKRRMSIARERPAKSAKLEGGRSSRADPSDSDE